MVCQSLVSQEMYKAIRAVAVEPSKRERDGVVIQKIGTHRIELKSISYQEFYVRSLEDGVVSL